MPTAERPVVAHIDPQPPGLGPAKSGASTGTVVSSPWIFSAAKTWWRIAATTGSSSQAAWPTQSLRVERSRSSPSRA